MALPYYLLSQMIRCLLRRPLTRMALPPQKMTNLSSFCMSPFNNNPTLSKNLGRVRQSNSWPNASEFLRPPQALWFCRRFPPTLPYQVYAAWTNDYRKSPNQHPCSSIQLIVSCLSVAGYSLQPNPWHDISLKLLFQQLSKLLIPAT